MQKMFGDRWSVGLQDTREALLVDPMQARKEMNLGVLTNAVFNDGDWVLLAKVDEALFSAIEQNRLVLTSRTAQVETPDGTAYLMLINQAGTFQSRVLLPLFVQSIALMFGSPKPVWVSVSLLSDTGGKANCFRAQLGGELIGSVRAMMQCKDQSSVSAWANGLASVVSEYRSPLAVKSILPNIQVERTCMTIVTPTERFGLPVSVKTFVFGSETPQ